MTKDTHPRNIPGDGNPHNFLWKFGERFHATAHLSNRALADEIREELMRAQKDLELPYDDCTFVVVVEDWSVCVEVHNFDSWHLVQEHGDHATMLAINKANIQEIVARFDWVRPHPERSIRPSDRRFRTYIHLVGFDEAIHCHLCEDWHPTTKEVRNDRTDTEHKG